MNTGAFPRHHRRFTHGAMQWSALMKGEGQRAAMQEEAEACEWKVMNAALPRVSSVNRSRVPQCLK